MGQREHDMPVADVEQIGALALDPPGLRQGLALWAVTVAARGVLDRHGPAVLALRLEPAERGGAAVRQSVHDPLLLGREPMGLAVRISALAQDVRDLQRRPRRRRCMVGMGHRSALGGTRELQQVQGRRGGARLVVGEMQVAHGRADGAVPEAALNDVQLDPSLKEPGGIAMPQRVDPAGLVDPSLLLGSTVNVCWPMARHRSAEKLVGEDPGLGTYAAPIIAQLLQQPGRERDVAVLAALPLIYAQTHPLRIDIPDLQAAKLARPKPRSIGRDQQGPVLAVGGDAEQPHQLVVVEEFGQDRRRLGARQVEMRFGQAERDAVEEADAVTGAVAALPGQPPLVVQEDEVVLDFLRRDPVRAAGVMKGEAGDGVEVGLLGVVGEAANGHVVDHALTKLCHGVSPSWSDRLRRHTHALAREHSGRRLSISQGEREPHRAPPHQADGPRQLAWCRKLLATPGGQDTPPRNAAQFNYTYADSKGYCLAKRRSLTPLNPSWHIFRPAERD